MMNLLKQNQELWEIFTRQEEYYPFFLDRHQRFPYYLSRTRNILEEDFNEIWELWNKKY